MEKRTKFVNRNIKGSKNCRCRYGDASSFDVLQVNITCNGKTESYQVDAAFLSKDTDSIHFYPSFENGRLKLRWSGDVEGHIRKVNGSEVSICSDREILTTKPSAVDVETKASNLKTGLLPWVGDNPRVLILGTLPSDVSIREQAYYQNKSHNSFWKIMRKLWPNDDLLGDEEFVKSHHIALWDCLHSAEREGSMDSGFGRQKLPNDIKGFLQKYPSIITIILNGTGDTTKIFNSCFGELKGQYEIKHLTSTSNANTRPFEDKFAEWKIVKDLCDE